MLHIKIQWPVGVSGASEEVYLQKLSLYICMLLLTLHEKFESQLLDGSTTVCMWYVCGYVCTYVHKQIAIFAEINGKSQCHFYFFIVKNNVPKSPESELPS
jgi:hypothetical protein